MLDEVERKNIWWVFLYVFLLFFCFNFILLDKFSPEKSFAVFLFFSFFIQESRLNTGRARPLTQRSRVRFPVHFFAMWSEIPWEWDFRIRRFLQVYNLHIFTKFLCLGPIPPPSRCAVVHPKALIPIADIDNCLKNVGFPFFQFPVLRIFFLRLRENWLAIALAACM